MFLLYHAYIYLELLILTCTIYILAPLYLSSEEELLRGLKQEYQSLEAEKMEEDNDTEVMEKSNCAIGCCTISMVQN